MKIFPGYGLSTLATLASRSRERTPSPTESGPDDASDPDQPSRDNRGGPDDTSDPDSCGRGGGDTYSGPDGPIDSSVLF